uniref:Putative methyltransferase n=3 Tax=viral metagenome TaxID=1070528 RepID=A0A6M3JMM0_9ZZZZ
MVIPLGAEMKLYDVIVVDPPWPVKKLTHKARPNQVDMDYHTMSVNEIADLSIENLAAESCWLFLWTTQKYLFQSLPILRGWGFNHLVTGVWEKTYGRSAGMPLYGFRWNVEFYLVGYRKKPDLWPKRSLIPLGFQAENIKHSQKPETFYDMISVLGKNKIDIFARSERTGWDVWGNEVESTAGITSRLSGR